MNATQHGRNGDGSTKSRDGEKHQGWFGKRALKDQVNTVNQNSYHRLDTAFALTEKNRCINKKNLCINLKNQPIKFRNQCIKDLEPCLLKTH